jgi:hypothetical protein
MTHSSNELPRGETVMASSPAAVWQAVEWMIEELDSGDRCVEYSVAGAVRSFDSVQGWLTDSIAAGSDAIRFTVDPNRGGVVRVDFAAVPREGAR